MYKILNNILEMDDYSLQRLSKSSSIIEYIWYKLWGNTVQNGTPTPDSPIMPQGTGDKTGNLWDEDYTGISTKAIYKPIYVGNENVTLSIDCPLYQSTGVLFILAGNVSSGISTDTNGVWLGHPKTVTPIDGYVTIAFRGYQNTSPVGYHAMLNTGSTPLPYEPYGYKIPIVCDNEIKNIYLNEPLHKINDYADILSYSEQGVVRKIKKLVLTGEESWTKSGNVYYITSIQPDYLRSANITTICTHYQSVANAEAASAVNVGEIALFSKVGANQRLYIGDDRFANTTEFTAYLASQYAAGTPVTVWYVLATEETEQIKAPDILADTYTSITVDTEIQPSQVDFTTKGKKVESTEILQTLSALSNTLEVPKEENILSDSETNLSVE